HVLEELKGVSTSILSALNITPQSTTTRITNDAPEQVVPRRSGRVVRQPERFMGLGESSEAVLDVLESDPWTYNEALQDRDAESWQKAMKSEIESMDSNQVWGLVEPPSGVRAIGCKWVYKRKSGADGKVETFKARLVAKGYTQKEGIDYEVTFSSVAMLKSIRILLAMAAHMDYEIWQIDVKTAFLNRNLDEDIFMQQLEGFIAKGQEQLVCKLKRSIYGLKQASRSWNIGFYEVVQSYGFTQCPDEHCVYKKSNGNVVVFLVLYMHAMAGIRGPRTMRLSARVKDRRVMVLVDNGSSHNFINADLSQKLNLPTTKIETFEVRVANGERLQCTESFRKVPIKFQGVTIKADLYALPLIGPDVVLGVQWLEGLGKVTTDYRTGVMDKEPHTEEAGQQQGDVRELLKEFEGVLGEPKGLPPHREFDHRIPLINEQHAVHVHPYRYAHFQKTEIERQVAEMLESGLIQHCKSLFSSPVLLAKKKDGTWGFCTDYRALNAVTIKDRFPIPSVDDMLDELAGSRYFSKLDLRAGYHQIRLHKADIPKTAFHTHQGHYEYLVMLFGLCNAPSTFQFAMNSVFKEHLRKF
ncbi:cysteine-rich RLK (RECEPTOR-like protein kinase) 8, partial [Striga hermonthica]